MTVEQFRAWLKRQAKANSLAELAKARGLSPSLVQMVAKGARDPSDNFLAAFGMERTEEIRKIREAKP